MRTYLSKKFKQQFAKVHRKLIQEIWDRAETGGRKAMAAPRGRGKSTVVKGMNIALVAAEKVRFIVPICATTKLGGRLYHDFQYEIGHNDLLLEDFPEICWPVRALDGAPQRAPRQHVDGYKTFINWSATDFLRLPRVPGNANDYLKSLGSEWSPYGGVKMTFCGLDAAFRGLNIDDDRPDYLIIDDPETRESAKSEEQIKNRIETIERDVEGLEGQDKPIAMVMITTIQNNYSLSAQFTDPEQRPSWDGERFGWVVKWPNREDLWEQYVEKRRAGQTKGDRHGHDAIAFYLANKDAMDEGVELLADTFKQTRMLDGTQLVHSAIQEVYNKIADTNKNAFFTEYQNDPPETVGPQGSGLSADIVMSRLSGLSRYQLPANTEALTAAIDVGKHYCHWCVTAWWKGAGGCVVDYGIVEVTANRGVRHEDKAADMEASEPAIYHALLNWRDELLAKDYVDATGTKRAVDFVLVDSGSYTNAVYEFVRQVQGIFHASKGQSPYHRRTKSTETCRAGANAHAQYQSAAKLWLFELDTDYWKQFIHERFLTPNFDEQNMLRRGSLSLYSPEGTERHTTYAQHIVSEELLSEFKEGKGQKTYWHKKNENNHWLDSTYMCAAALERLGVKLITPSEIEITPQTAKPKVAPARKQHGMPINPSGWMQRFNKRRR
jgi:hypothetical protein